MMKKNFILLLFALFTVVSVWAQKAPSMSKNVLFIGNSYMQVNDLPLLTKNVASSAGYELTYRANMPGGATFANHCVNGSKDMILEGGWDLVMIQGQSQEPSFPDGQVAQETFPYAAQLVAAVYQANPCAEPMFYMTWGRKDGDSYNAQFFPPLGSYEGMDSLLYLRYMMMKEANDASVSPVGRLWHVLRNTHPEIELYSSDNSHPSLAGSYAAACSFFTTIFEADPTTITFNPGIDESIASIIRQTAKTVVYDNLSFWKRPLPTSGYTYNAMGGLSVQFNNNSQNASQYEWFFGDGETSHQESPSHTYSEEGSYNVMLIAQRHCNLLDTIQTSITVSGSSNPAGIEDQMVTGLRVYPNPAIGHVTIEMDRDTEISVFDSQLRLVKVLTVHEGANLIDLTQYPQGILYLVRDGRPVAKMMNISR